MAQSEEGPKEAPYTTHHYGNPNDPEDHKDEQGSEIVGACDINTVNKLKKENPGGFFLIVSQEGCGDCDSMKRVLDEVVKDKKPVIEAPMEDKQCVSLADQLKVGITPTVIYYQGDQERRLVPDGKATWDQMRAQIRELVEKPLAPAPPVH